MTRAAAILATAALCVLALFHQTAVSLVQTWLNNPSFAHGIAVVPVALWLAWERRHRLAAEVARPAALAVVPFAACALIWGGARASAVLIVEQAALIGMLQWLVPAVLGWRAALILASPMLFLIFALPVGDDLVPWLQDVTLATAVSLRQWAGLVTVVDGRVLSTPAGLYEVAEVCSGLRFLIAAVATSFLAADILFVRLWKRAAFIATSAAAAILANGIRVFGIMLVGDHFGDGAAATADHVAYGWAFLSAILAGMAAIGWALRDPAPAPRSVERASAPAPGRLAVPLTAAVAVGLAALFSVWMGNPDAAPQATATEDKAVADWQPATPGADVRRLEIFTAADRQVDRLIAVYATQRHGKEAVGSSNDLAGPGWHAIDSWRRKVTLEGRPITVPIQRLIGREGQRLLIYWYWADGALTGSPVAAKFLHARAALLGGNPTAAVVAVSLPLDGRDDLAAANAALDHFLANQQGHAALLAMAADDVRPPHRD